MYKSETEKKFFHSKIAQDNGISKAISKEFSSTNKGMKLPKFAKLKDKLFKKEKF